MLNDMTDAVAADVVGDMVRSFAKILLMMDNVSKWQSNTEDNR